MRYYIQSPMTPMKYIGLSIRMVIVAFAIMGVIMFLLSSLGSGGGGAFGFLYTLFSPVFDQVFWWSGVDAYLGANKGYYALFTLLLLPALFNILQVIRLRLQELRYLEENFGPINRPEHVYSFAVCCILLLVAAGLRYFPRDEFVTTDFALMLANASRIVIWLAALAGALGYAVIGFSLKASWARNPASLKAAKRAQGKVRLMVDNTKAPAAKRQDPVKLIEPESSPYVALTAALVQAAGYLKAMPTASDIAEPLMLQQKASSMTNSGVFAGIDIRDLCERACALVVSGQLATLPDLKTLQALYKKADPARLQAIAAELRAKLDK
jgi:hypothetical protein